ncbi:C39 family peptidase [Streptomyces sp. NPDC047000]|uniref:C39 family peptidase n=1 Tax=Streptomyces sp. NPDC047000 TaxID=3155474 RepID=UPI0034035149
MRTKPSKSPTLRIPPGPQTARMTACGLALGTVLLAQGTPALALAPDGVPSRQTSPALSAPGNPAHPAQSPTRPRSAVSSSDVPLYGMQLRNDCEATALRMVLAARGVRATDQEILNRIGVDRVHYRFGDSGPLSGDPFRSFVGDPNGSEVAGTGFGVYHPPVAAAARSYGLGVSAAGQGISLDLLRSQVTQGHPAIVWVDYLWRRAALTSYTAYDGTRVPYAGPAEHSVVVTGFSGGTVTVNDPARGRLSLPLASFAGAYATYGNMAVIVQ